MDINALVKITSRAWALQILALMHNGIAGRQAALLAASGAGRTAFAHSLSHLIELSLLERNPGHGHPLRPEFRLTAAGIKAAAMAATVQSIVPNVSDGGLIRRAWTLPILAVNAKPRYFAEIKQALPLITDRALSQSLMLLQGQQWLTRQVDVTLRPPRPLYVAANTGAELSHAIGLMAA